MKNVSKTSGFTLVEFVIAITIFFILAVASYAPYSYYGNKARLKQTTRETNQLLYEARNMAINGSITSSGNLAVGVYFDSANQNEVRMYTYPHHIAEVDISTSGNGIELHKTYNLQRGVQIDAVNTGTNMLFFFNAITGEGKYYYWDAFGQRQEYTGNEIEVDFSYKGSTAPNLQKQIHYFPSTNIVDY